MKSGAIVRIVLWSVVALVLTGLLVSIMFMKNGGGTFNNLGISFGGGSHYADSEKYSIGGADISDKIDSVEVNWVNGKVNVEKYDGNTINISETGNTDKDNTLRYLVKDGKLTIQYRESGWIIGIIKNQKKELTVKIPSLATTFDNFKIDSVSATVMLSDITAKSTVKINNVSGNVNLNNIAADKLNIDNVSGEIKVENVKADTIESDTVSGDITVSGEVSSFDSDSTSGEVHLTDKKQLKKLKLDSVSGDGTVIIPDDSSFSVDFHSISGDFNSDFPIVSKNGERICGSGSAYFNIDTTSGDFTVNKLSGVQ